MDYEFPINEATPEPLAIQPKPKTALQPISSDMVDGSFQKMENAEREKDQPKPQSEDESRPTAFPSHPTIDQSKLYPTPLNHNPAQQTTAPSGNQPQATILTMEPVTGNSTNYVAWKTATTIVCCIILVLNITSALPMLTNFTSRPSGVAYFGAAIAAFSILCCVWLLLRKDWARLIYVVLGIIRLAIIFPLLFTAAGGFVILQALIVGFFLLRPVSIQYS